MRSLLRRQLPRQLHVGRCVQISIFARLARDRHSVAFQPEHLPVLRRRRNLQAERFPCDGADIGFAAKNGHVKVVRLLVVESGADVNAKDRLEKTPLHQTAGPGDSAFDANGFTLSQDDWRKFDSCG